MGNSLCTERQIHDTFKKISKAYPVGYEDTKIEFLDNKPCWIGCECGLDR